MPCRKKTQKKLSRAPSIDIESISIVKARDYEVGNQTIYQIMANSRNLEVKKKAMFYVGRQA